MLTWTDKYKTRKLDLKMKHEKPSRENDGGELMERHVQWDKWNRNRPQLV